MFYNTTMRRVFCVLFILILAGCRAVTPTPATATPTPAPASLPPTAVPRSTETPTLAPATPTPSATAQPVTFEVMTHPDGPLYVGDRVSFEIIPVKGKPPEGSTVTVKLQGESQPLGKAKFDPFGMVGRFEAVLTWAWDTRSLEAGPHILSFTIEPGGQSWTQSFTLLPRQQMPPPQANATWAEARSTCCVVYYLTGTESERDLPELLTNFDSQASDVAARMGTNFTQPVTITLMSRVLGHGGFATDEIMVSYLDRNYIGGEAGFIIHHEMVHILDARLGGDLRPSMLVEGLAVYMTGGHFKPEPLMPRAAVLLDSWGDPPTQGLGWYIPLATLADQFYTSQHEVGYLEAASLIEYMIQRWGQTAFFKFYRDIHPDSSGSQARAIDTALIKHFSLSFSQLEADFITALKHEPPRQDLLDDVRLTVNYLDTARRYQLDLDPSAHFLTAWIVDVRRMRELGITADYLRHPSTVENVALETMLIAAHTAWNQQHISEAQQMLAGINAVLAAVEARQTAPFEVDPLATDYLSVVEVLRSDPQVIFNSPGGDVEPQAIQIKNNLATAWLDYGKGAPVEVELEKIGGLWKVLPATEGFMEIAIGGAAILYAAYR